MTLYARAGGEGRETVVFLHGFGGYHAGWNEIAEAVEDRASTLAYDLPGHGESHDYPDAGPAKIAAQAILSDLAARDPGTVHLVGHSMGGAIAALMAILEPARIASLTLLSPGGFGPDINHRLLTRYAAARDEAALLPCLEAMYGWFSPVADAAVTQTLAARAAEGRSDTLVRIASGLVRDGKQGQLPLERLSDFPGRISVAWGGLDNVLPVRQSAGLPSNFGVHLFPDLGHMLPQEAPERMTDLIGRTAGF